MSYGYAAVPLKPETGRLNAYGWGADEFWKVGILSAIQPRLGYRTELGLRWTRGLLNTGCDSG